jgi:hypothetical protein
VITGGFVSTTVTVIVALSVWAGAGEWPRSDAVTLIGLEPTSVKITAIVDSALLTADIGPVIVIEAVPAPVTVAAPPGGTMTVPSVTVIVTCTSEPKASGSTTEIALPPLNSVGKPSSAEAAAGAVRIGASLTPGLGSPGT